MGKGKGKGEREGRDREGENGKGEERREEGRGKKMREWRRKVRLLLNGALVTPPFIETRKYSDGVNLPSPPF